MRFLLFFLIWFSLLGATGVYLGLRMIRPARLQGKRRLLAWLGTGSVLLLPQIPFLALVSGMESTGTEVFAWVGYVLLGYFSSVLTLVFLRDVLLGGLILIRKVGGRFNNTIFPPYDPERRRTLVHSTNLGILGTSAILTGYGVIQSMRKADIETHEVAIRNLPSAFDGFRIVQFSDIHAGPTIKRAFVERITEAVLELKPDLIAFTGDLVDGSVGWLRDDVAPLTSLAAPNGIFFVTGNHEYYSGVMPWIQEAQRIGFDVLLNEYRAISKNGASIVVAGVTDYGAGDFVESQRSDPRRSIDGAPSDAPMILLAHQPRSVFEASAAGFDLQLSGHTHGGQFFPWNHLATLGQPYIKGLHRHNDTWIYVNKGAGYWGPPVRIGASPEITVVVLRRAPPEKAA